MNWRFSAARIFMLTLVLGCLTLVAFFYFSACAVRQMVFEIEQSEPKWTEDVYREEHSTHTTIVARLKSSETSQREVNMRTYEYEGRADAPIHRR